jgi:Ricin-type beta-trefoil lectin domain-like
MSINRTFRLLVVMCTLAAAACGGGGGGGGGASGGGTGTPTPVPSAPTNLVATAGNASVMLSWNPSMGATSYNVKRAAVSGGPYTVIATQSGQTYSDSALTNGTNYYYVVSALNAGGESVNSTEASAQPTAPAQIPSVPSNLSAASGNATVTLTWSASASATGYHVKRATTSGGPYMQIAAPSAATYIDTAVSNGTSYYYVVSALNTAGESANSAQVTAVPTVPASGIANGTYYFVNVNSGLVLGDPGTGGSGVVVQQATPSGNTGQLWTVTSLGSGLYSIVNVGAALPLDANNSGGSGTAVDVYTSNGGANQKWSFTALSSGVYAISPSYNPALNIDINSSSVAAGAAVQVFTASNAANQQFQLVPSGAQATIIVNPVIHQAPVTDQILGMNMAYWYDPSNAAIVPALQTAGIKALRWPGGSGSDVYHWSTNSLCGGGYTANAANFSNFLTDVVVPSGVDLAVTANYGTNAACTGPGDPSEAAAWVTAAKTNGHHVSHWTVGNEVYGTWETDMHAIKNDPATYATAVGTASGSTGFYPQMKAADPNTLIGVVVQPNSVAASGKSWDPTVLSNASYDFVEYHFYAQAPGRETDAYLVGQAAQALTSSINSVKADLAAAGHANTPIYVGELGSVYTNPGIQSTSITQALYAGQVLGELMNAGVSRATWWIGFGGCFTSTSSANPNYSSSLYGWQTYGGYNVFSDGGNSCGPTAAGVLLPTARAFQLFSSVAVDGEFGLAAPVAGDAGDVRAYAATHGGGTVLVLFNTNETTAKTVTVMLAGKATSSAVTVQTYDKSIYDQSKTGVWAPPTTTSMGTQSLPLMLTLTPWSMNIVTIAR